MEVLAQARHEGVACRDGVEQDLEAAYRWVVAAGADALGAPVHNRDRDRLQAALERALPLEVQARVREAGADD